MEYRSHCEQTLSLMENGSLPCSHEPTATSYAKPSEFSPQATIVCTHVIPTLNFRDIILKLLRIVFLSQMVGNIVIVMTLKPKHRFRADTISLTFYKIQQIL